MKRKNFAYYYIQRHICALDGTEKKEVSYYVVLRLEDTLLHAEDLQSIVGLTNVKKIPPEHKGVCMDLERQFHCAATKKIAGHLAFTLEYRGEDGKEYAPWGKALDTSIAYDKAKLFTIVESGLYGYTFKPKGSEAQYEIVPGSIKEKRRRGE